MTVTADTSGKYDVETMICFDQSDNGSMIIKAEVVERLLIWRGINDREERWTEGSSYEEPEDVRHVHIHLGCRG